MPWNGSGTYAPPAASFPEVPGTTIDAARFNATVNDLASGITAALAKNGENAATANLPMGGFKHTGAAVAANANEYVTWNQTGVKFPALGIGTTSSAWGGTGFYAIDIGPRSALFSDPTGVNIGANTYYDGTNYRAKETAAGAIITAADGALAFFTMASASAGAIQTTVERFRITVDGDVIHNVNTAAPPLSFNKQMVFALTSNTNLRISVRGSDGTTRVANITLA